jgi:hypothetical protein
MHPLLAQYQHTLLGRLRAKLLADISGGMERLPTDRELYSDLMAEWKKNAEALRTAKAVVRLRMVRLFDENFGLSLDAKDIARWAKHLQTGDDDLLVYWDGESFISSDDYYGYLGYRLLGREEVRVVIMGEFPSAITKVERRGTDCVTNRTAG